MTGLTLFVTGCTGDDGDQGPPGPQGPPGGSGTTSTDLTQGDTVPGVVLEILDLSGGTGASGAFAVGDTITVHYTAEKTDGSTWDISEFTVGRILLSGPSFNYQRVIPEASDVVAASVQQADGSYKYTFASAIPATYAAPLNDTASFGVEDGEMTGQALLNGTYTIGLYFGWSFTVDDTDSHRDAGNTTVDFLIGTGTLDHREVVTQGNCNSCHESFQIHGQLRRDVTLCALCHTSGSEDKNNPAIGNGTPGVSIDFKVLIHKIHNGEHLPSVNGVATNPDGTRNYAATPIPYQVVGNSAHDYSAVAFPVWPSLNIAMPRDAGYTALSTTNKATEDRLRTGVVACDKCHGDPDGSGPLAAPEDGDLYHMQPSRQSCGSCHDDISWGDPYTANLQTMPAQANNANCTLCHESTGNGLSVIDAHVHPLLDPNFNPGLNVDITDVSETGTNNGDGTIDPGEKIAITFALTDDLGANVAAASVGTTLSVVVSGPTSNYNMLLNTSIATAALTGSSPYTTNVPTPVLVEYLGTAVAGADSFLTASTPVWNVASATTTVYQTVAQPPMDPMGNTLATSATVVPQNYIDVVNGADFQHDDYVVIDEAVVGFREYARVQSVLGNRVWFGSTASTAYPQTLRFAHLVNATVREVELGTVAATNYTVTPATGAITEAGAGFTTGAPVLVSYTTDFVMPSVYPLAINDSPDVDDSWGKWSGKPIVDGTYSIGVWGARSLSLVQNGETDSYRGTSQVVKADFLVGSASATADYALISSGNSCYDCHSDLYFHGGGRRGWEACLLCHGAAGSEDRSQYVAPGAPATTGASVNFRTMLHKIHMGEELANASAYQLVGFGSTAYPNNFGVVDYAEVVFPALPGQAAQCAKCHGTANSWYLPTDRNHPTAQVLDVRPGRATCGACHDSDAAQAHIEVQTSGSGVESCDVCHGANGEWNVQRMHKSY